MSTELPRSAARRAAALCLLLLALSPAAGETEAERARRLFAQGDFREASRVLQMLSYRNETGEAEEVLLAATYSRLGDEGRARAVLARAADRFPGGALVPLAAGELDLARGRHEEAYDWFALSQRRAPSPQARAGMAAALRGLAVIRIEAGRHEEALALLERAAAIAPLDPDAEASLGRLLEEQGRVVEADAAYARALELGSDDPRAAYRQALRLRSLTEAQVAAGQAVRQVGALQMAAVGVLATARGPEAARAGAEAAAAQRRLQAARALLTDCLDLLAELSGPALEGELERLLDWYPHTAALKEEAAARYAARGRWERALALWRETLRDDPRNSRAQAGAGAALRALGRLDESALYLRRALSLDAEDPRLYEELIAVYRAQGGEARLFALLEERALVDPRNEPLAAALADLRAGSR